MNSSMLAGERRWASARRGGMTVLGKVTVPKPINLPSQRLENHGLDPNVEIVPKGTVSWGSRSSSSGSSPWTSSSLSPNADGGTVSPSHLSGRPSSGGSGTRPSTSGSDRTHDPAPNAWASNSRPSSASGTLSSNQTSSSSLRPRSAENRPNSSQLSRFAEPVSKTSAAWGSSATAERLGVKSLKEDSFSLSSGDFPTLGSEKDNSVKNVESEDCRPSSASGIVQAKEENLPHADMKHETVNTWRAESSPHAEDDIHPSMEKWQGDPHQYFNPNTAPQHFEGWRGPPMNGPAGNWYGGRPRGPAFGAHVPPGGFPMEPFPYYRPQIPPPPLAGSQPVPPRGPRGPHPKNGDLYRPQMHEAYPRPGMPFRPNFYPGPPGPMPFEGYYGPPMGYCNSERDIPYMGMATGPPVYNGYPAPAAPDISNSHGRAAARGPTGKTMSEQVETGHSEDTYGPKRVPLNSHNEYEQKEEGGHREQNVPPNILHPGKPRFPVSSRRNEWGAEEDAEEPVIAKRMAPSETPSNSYGNRIYSADGIKVKSFEGTRSAKGVDNNWTKSEGLPSLSPVAPQLPVSGDRDAALPATTKNSALMHKIDGLNAKFRVSDGVNDSTSAYNRGEERTGSQIADTKVTNYPREVGNAAGSSQRNPASRNYASAPNEVTVPVGDNPMQPVAVVSRRSYHAGHPKVDTRGKGKFNGQDADGWRRKPLNTDSSSAIAAPNNESAPIIHSHGPNYVGEASENSVIDPTGKTEGDSVEVCDSADIQAQRAKMREIAKQRALQLQREEEERVREQKAKALAKLEELDRRKMAGEAANQKGERTPIIGDIRVGQQESHTVIGTVIAELKTNESGFNLVLSPAVASVETDSSTKHAGKSVEVPRILLPVMQQKGLLESNVSPLPRNEDSEDGSTKKAPSQSDDGGISRHKRAGYKQKQTNMSQKSLNEKTVSSTTFEVQNDHTHVASADMHQPPPSDTIPSDSNVLNASNTVVEPSAQRKRINRSNKPKPKPDESPSAPALPPVTSDVTHGNESIDNGGSYNSVSNLSAPVSTLSEPDRSVQTQEVSSSLPSEESQSKVSNQWKPHPSRRIPKNQQAHRFTDKHHASDTVVWAPKAKGSDEVSQTSVQESANSVKGNNVVQNSLKGKRAEMERYVPKPQLAQQGSAPPLSSVSSSRSNEGAVGELSGSAIPENVRSNLDINVGDSSHNKNKKDHVTWRQRGPTDSSQTKGVQTGLKDSSQVKGVHTGPSPVSEPTKDVQQSKELVQFGTSEINRVSAETKTAGGNHTSMDATTTAVNKHPPAKDQGATGRGKRHPPRGPRSSGNNPDPDNTSYSEVDGGSVQSSALDGNQMDKSTIPKENRSFGERAYSHWQRKSGPNSANNQQGNRNAGSEYVTLETNRIPRKDNPQHKVQVMPQQEKESSNSSQPQPQPGQSFNIKSNVADDSVARRHQDFEREKKLAPVKGRPYSPNQDPVGSGESPHTNTDDQHDHNVTSGTRRTGRQNNRPVRGHDPRGEWSSGHDNRPHIPAFRDRQRQNVHLEYQPVGHNHKPEKVEELGDGGADSMDQRYRERGQSHSKRGGNFFRR